MRFGSDYQTSTPFGKRDRNKSTPRNFTQPAPNPGHLSPPPPPPPPPPPNPLPPPAETYFPAFGFAPIARAEVEPAVQASVEFAGACPASAAVMALTLAS
ncbi:MAG TPA: hypothetical protein PKE55_02540 [Kiritimatiellia bacterium]|nr:hypothetical protein [Kiritimatiellia bacterium]